MFHVFFFFNNSNFKITARQGLNKFNQLKGLWAKDHSEPGISHQGNIILLLPLPSLREEKSKLLRKRRGEKKEKGKEKVGFFLPEAHLTFTKGKRIQTWVRIYSPASHRTRYLSCLTSKFSSSNIPPNMDSPPLPLPSLQNNYHLSRGVYSLFTKQLSFFHIKFVMHIFAPFLRPAPPPYNNFYLGQNITQERGKNMHYKFNMEK